jgi:hypothetical protein
MHSLDTPDAGKLPVTTGKSGSSVSSMQRKYRELKGLAAKQVQRRYFSAPLPMTDASQAGPVRRRYYHCTAKKSTSYCQKIHL